MKSLLHDTRGHATGEAVIMIPMFVLIWGFIVWGSQTYERAIDVGATTRQHAWSHVMNACEGGAAGGTEMTDATDPPLGPIGEALSALDTVIGMLPWVGDYWPGFVPEERQFLRRDNVSVPEAVGGGSTRVGHTIVLMCNENLETPDLQETSDASWGIFGF